jgi:hypothetical protein
VVSQGGVAGVGETLRRLPWENAHVSGERVQTEMDSRHFESLEQLSRDQWPGR